MTFRVDEELLDRLDAAIEEGMFANRSAAVRDGLRQLIQHREFEREEIASLVDPDGSHISDIPIEQREVLRDDIETELLDEYPIEEIDDLYVTGSWVRGEAIEGVSDLDIVAAVDPANLSGSVVGVREHFKNEFSPDRCEHLPFLFIDLWVEPGRPTRWVRL